MRRKIQIKGYTRVYKGKTVKVKPYSRMVGTDTSKEDSTKGKPGDEFSSMKGAKETKDTSPKAATEAYKPGEYAYQFTEEEWNEMVRAAARKREEEHGALRNRKRAKKEDTPKRAPSKYSSLPGLAGGLNRLADKLAVWADAHSHKRRK